jgi:hypothetical protein
MWSSRALPTPNLGSSQSGVGQHGEPKSTKLAAIHVKSCCPSFTQLSAGISSINSKNQPTLQVGSRRDTKFKWFPTACVACASSFALHSFSDDDRLGPGQGYVGMVPPVTWVVLGWFKPFQNISKLQVTSQVRLCAIRGKKENK